MLEEGNQEYVWYWPIHKKVKWLVNMIVKKRRRHQMVALKREDEANKADKLIGIDMKEDQECLQAK